MGKLPKARFNLKSPKSTKETLILLIFRYRGKKLQYSTSLNIHPSDWDKADQRPIIQIRRQDLFMIQRELDNLASYCMDIFISADYGAISVEEFKSRLDIKTGKKVIERPLKSKPRVKKRRISFFKFIEEELQEMKGHMSKASLKPFQLHARILKEFAVYYGGKKLFTYEDVDWELRLKLIDWLTKRNVQLGYGNKTLKILKQFLERARRKKLHSNIDYQGKGWTIPRKKAKGQIVTLNVEELNILAQMNLSGHLAKVRDICLIGAGTGQRYSDFSIYAPESFYISIKGIPLLSMISNKTDTPTKVPLNIFPWLIPTLEKHDYTTPKMDMQQFNYGLKELAELAGFDNRILIVEQYMGRKAKVEKYYMKKYEVVSSHICRRSFATNLYRMGYRLSQIMLMTGHSTESQLRQYIGIDNEQNAEEIGLMILQQNGQSFSNLKKLQAV